MSSTSRSASTPSPELRRRHAGLALLFILFVAASSCSYGTGSASLPTGPSPLQWLGSVPSPGASAVALDAPIDLLFNVPPAAEALGIGDVALVSGTTTIPSELTVDLIERRLRLNPLQELRPTLRHNVIIKDLLGLDGSRLPQTVTFEFTTGRQRQGSPGAVTAVSATEVQPIWDRHCARCHAGQHPRAGLDLSSVQASLGALVEVPSSESPLRRVSSGDHATSYLMRKLLGRLAIVGLPMPPDAPQLPPDQLRLVADWIDTGALP